MITKLFFLFFIVLLMPLTMANVTFYSDITLYFDNGDIEVTFVDTGISMYYCEFDTTNDYILLENINLSFHTANSLTINVSQLNSSNSVLTDTTVIRFNATATASTLFNFTGNISSVNVKYEVYIDNILTYYKNDTSFNFTINSWSTKDIEIIYTGLVIPDPPYDGNSLYNETNILNLSWSRGNYSDREVILRKANSYPLSPTDGIIVYNYTNTYYNATVTDSGYYTVWSYNSTFNVFSLTGLNIPWGGINIYNVLNESDITQSISPFGILISDSLGSATYQNNSCTLPHVIDSINDIPIGNNIIFIINATNYKTTKSIKTISLNTWYNFTFYLPPFETQTDPGGGDPGGSGENYSTTQSYVIRVIDGNNQPIQNALVLISKYLNESFEEVRSDLTDGYGEVSFSLVPQTLYKVNISKIGFQSLTGQNFIPDPNYYGQLYPKVYQLEYDEPEPPPQQYEPEEIFFTVEKTGNLLFLNFSDPENSMIDNMVKIYGENVTNNTRYLLKTFSNTSTNSFNVIINVNKYDGFIILLFYNNTYFQNITRVFTISAKGTVQYNVPSGAYINVLLAGIIGYNPFGWGNFLIWLFLLAGCYYMDGKHAGEIMVILGGIFLFVNLVFGFNTTLATVAGGVIPTLFVIVGIISMWKENKKKVVT